MSAEHDVAFSTATEVVGALQGLDLTNDQLIVVGEIAQKIIPIFASAIKTPATYSAAKLDPEILSKSMDVLKAISPSKAVNPENLKMILAFLTEMLPIILQLFFPKQS
jgi:hypothetical protein